MSSKISAGTTSATALNMSADTSGSLELRVNNTTTALTFDTGGAATFASQVDAPTIDAAGYAYRVRANSGNTTGSIQWTNTAASQDWYYISSTAQNRMVVRSAQGSNTAVDNATISFNGSYAAIRPITSSGGDIGDWPIPTLGLTGYDSNFNYVTMQTFCLRDDASMYETGTGKWNFRLGTGTNGKTVSDSSTAMYFGGPGTLTCTSASNGVILNLNATSWASASDERMKDIIEPITDAAAKVATLRTVIGKYKTEPDGTRRPMLIAQDVEAVLPEAVTPHTFTDPIDENDIYKVPESKERLTLSYTEVIPLLTAAIKELKQELDSVKAELAVLKGAK